jgi:gluconokinase
MKENSQVQKIYVGIDLGTSFAKIVAVQDGTLVFEQRTEYVNDPFHTVIELLGGLISHFPSTHSYSIAFSSAMHSVMGVLEDTIITDILTWMDNRSSSVSTKLTKGELADKLYATTGTPVHPMSPLCKITYLREQEERLRDENIRWVSIKEWVWWKITGKWEVDISVASATGLYDIHEKRWNPASLLIAGITESQLSEVVPMTYPSVDTLGAVSSKFPGIHFHWVMGGSDGVMATIGSGALALDQAALTIGTSGAIRVLTKEVPDFTRHGLFCYAIDEILYLCGGPMNNGGAVLHWFATKVLEEPLQDTMGIRKFVEESMNADPGDLIFLPYIYGERAPYWDPFLRGSFIGLSAEHGKKEMKKAVWEGISFAMKQIMDKMLRSGININLIRVSGGFTASSFWVQHLCNLLEAPMEQMDSVDASAIGAAYMSYLSEHPEADYNGINRWLKIAQHWNPQPIDLKVRERMSKFNIQSAIKSPDTH